MYSRDSPPVVYSMLFTGEHHEPNYQIYLEAFHVSYLSRVLSVERNEYHRVKN